MIPTGAGRLRSEIAGCVALSDVLLGCWAAVMLNVDA